MDRASEDAMQNKALSSFSAIGDNFTEAVQNAVDTADIIKENNQAVKDLYSGIKSIEVAKPDYTEVTAAVKDAGSIVEKLFSFGDMLLDSK